MQILDPPVVSNYIFKKKNSFVFYVFYVQHFGWIPFKINLFCLKLSWGILHCFENVKTKCCPMFFDTRVLGTDKTFTWIFIPLLNLTLCPSGILRFAAPSKTMKWITCASIPVVFCPSAKEFCELNKWSSVWVVFLSEWVRVCTVRMSCPKNNFNNPDRQGLYLLHPVNWN